MGDMGRRGFLRGMAAAAAGTGLALATGQGLRVTDGGVAVPVMEQTDEVVVQPGDPLVEGLMMDPGAIWGDWVLLSASLDYRGDVEEVHSAMGVATHAVYRPRPARLQLEFLLREDADLTAVTGPGARRPRFYSTRGGT